MRAATAILLCAFFAAATPAVAQSCVGPALPNAPNRVYDRSWIRSDAAFYAADDRGVFQIRLGSNEVRWIGAHAGEQIENLALSPKKRWVEYERQSPFAYWLYDIANKYEHKLEVHSIDGVNLLFSADETQVAWLERDDAQHRIAVLDLNGFEKRSFRLLDAPDPKAIFYDLTWSASGDVLTYAWRDAERQEFYSVDAVTGLAKSIPSPREFGADEFLEGAYLLGERAAPNGSNPRPGVHEHKDSIALERGANVRYANRRIVVTAPGRRARTIGCGPRIKLLDAFEGRYVFYRTGNRYWIYGLRESRKAVLFDGAAPLEW
jgi:hypothetical protein